MNIPPLFQTVVILTTSALVVPTASEPIPPALPDDAETGEAGMNADQIAVSAGPLESLEYRVCEPSRSVIPASLSADVSGGAIATHPSGLSGGGIF